MIGRHALFVATITWIATSVVANDVEEPPRDVSLVGHNWTASLFTAASPVLALAYGGRGDPNAGGLVLFGTADGVHGAPVAAFRATLGIASVVQAPPFLAANTTPGLASPSCTGAVGAVGAIVALGGLGNVVVASSTQHRLLSLNMNGGPVEARVLSGSDECRNVSGTPGPLMPAQWRWPAQNNTARLGFRWQQPSAFVYRPSTGELFVAGIGAVLRIVGAASDADTIVSEFYGNASSGTACGEKAVPVTVPPADPIEFRTAVHMSTMEGQTTYACATESKPFYCYQWAISQGSAKYWLGSVLKQRGQSCAAGMPIWYTQHRSDKTKHGCCCYTCQSVATCNVTLPSTPSITAMAVAEDRTLLMVDPAMRVVRAVDLATGLAYRAIGNGGTAYTAGQCNYTTNTCSAPFSGVTGLYGIVAVHGTIFFTSVNGGAFVIQKYFPLNRSVAFPASSWSAPGARPQLLAAAETVLFFTNADSGDVGAIALDYVLPPTRTPSATTSLDVSGTATATPWRTPSLSDTLDTSLTTTIDATVSAEPTGGMLSSSATLVVPALPREVLVPTAVSNAVEGTGSAATVVGIVSPTAAVVAARGRAIARGLACPQAAEDVDAPPFMSYPLQIPLGPADGALALHRGAAVLNLVLTLALTLMSVACCRAHVHARASEFVCGVAYAVSFLLVQPSMESAALLLSLGDAWAAAAVAGAVCWGLLVAAAIVAVWRARPTYVRTEPSVSSFGGAWLDAGGIWVVVEEGTEPLPLGPPEGEAAYGKTLGRTHEDYRMLWFAALEVLVSAVAGALGGVQGGTAEVCQGVGIAAAVMYSAYLVAVVVARPFHQRGVQLGVGATAVLLCGMAWAVVVGQRGGVTANLAVAVAYCSLGAESLALLTQLLVTAHACIHKLGLATVSSMASAPTTTMTTTTTASTEIDFGGSGSCEEEMELVVPLLAVTADDATTDEASECAEEL